MSKHDFYADPTLFDHWQSHLEGWLSEQIRKLSPWSWFIGFSGLALLFVCVAVSVFICLLQNKLGAMQAQAWNQSMAQGVTVVAALLASQHLMRQAIEALPRGIRWPASVRALVSVMSSTRTRDPRRAPNAPAVVPVTVRPAEPGPQEFFASVRAAGVNVRTAKALFSAGIRSPRHLLALKDADLLRIRGIGPATVRKLRNHFSPN